MLCGLLVGLHDGCAVVQHTVAKMSRSQVVDPQLIIISVAALQ